MEYLQKPIKKSQIVELQEKYGDYIKITADIVNNLLVAGCPLHADGEAILLKNGSIQEDIWAGGINFLDKEIDTTAVLNIRPSLDNNSLEILNSERRKKFIEVVKYIFQELWI